MEIDKLSGGLAALGQPLRMNLFQRLVAAGTSGAKPGELAAKLDLQHNLVSYHLQPLVAAGLVTSERQGREVIYRANPIGVNRLAAALLDVSSGH